MKKNQSKTFQYIKIENEGNRYFCVQQNLGVVAWILFCKHDIFRPIIRTHPTPFSLKSSAGWLRKRYGLLRRNVRVFLHFAVCRFQLRGAYSVRELPCYGQLCLPVHKGHKIFDLRRNVVIKVFDHDVPDSVILGEIEQLQHISKIDFAPSIRKWNVEERWYEEDYLNGVLDSSYKPMESETLLTTFHNNVVHQLNALILFQEPKLTNVVTYVTDLIKKTPVTRLGKQESTSRERRRMTGFIDSMVAQLECEGACHIFRVFAHGDFVPANMLNTPHGMKMIDWEGCGYRSALFDFYSYFFYRSTSRNIPVSTLITEIQKALPHFILELTKKAQDVSQSIRCLENVYRWTFYIEMLCRLIERKMSDKNLNVLYYLSRYLDAFTRYEEMLAGHFASSSRIPN